MNKLYLAVDLGTTIVDYQIIDADGRKSPITGSFRNPESLYGLDVISRITNAVGKPSLAGKMKELFSDALFKNVSDKLKDNGLDASDIIRVVIAGNTTMLAILLEKDLSPMGVYPFKSDIKESVTLNAEELFGESFFLSCEVSLIGCFDTFIGGDIASGIIYLADKYDFLSKNKISLLADLGTNGELVLWNKGTGYATSTACGPAFENCLRRQNSFGTTALKAIALGVKTGKISREGVISKAAFESGIDIMGCHIDMDILRQIILAKAAVYAGIVSLIRLAGITPHEIDSVYVSGGFGTFLDIEDAVYIGMLPGAFRKKVIQVGNTSLMGAAIVSDDIKRLEAADCFIRDGGIRAVNFGGNESYQELLLESMSFYER